MTPESSETISAIVKALAAIRPEAQPEECDLHVLVARALGDSGIACRHEVRIAPRCRVDFLAGRIAIEVKKGRPSPALLRRQVERYLGMEALDGIVVAAQIAVDLPRLIHGKPVAFVALNRNWGVALP